MVVDLFLASALCWGEMCVRQGDLEYMVLGGLVAPHTLRHSRAPLLPLIKEVSNWEIKVKFLKIKVKSLNLSINGSHESHTRSGTNKNTTHLTSFCLPL